MVVKIVLALASMAVSGRAQILQDGGNSCRLMTLIPFTDLREGIGEVHRNPDMSYLHYGYGTWPDEETLGKASFSLMAAAEIARKHFDDRNATVGGASTDSRNMRSRTGLGFISRSNSFDLHLFRNQNLGKRQIKGLIEAAS